MRVWNLNKNSLFPNYSAIAGICSEYNRFRGVWMRMTRNKSIDLKRYKK